MPGTLLPLTLDFHFLFPPKAGGDEGAPNAITRIALLMASYFVYWLLLLISFLGLL